MKRRYQPWQPPGSPGDCLAAALSRPTGFHAERVDRTPGLKEVVSGVKPDRFVRQFSTGQGATVRDVTRGKRSAAAATAAVAAAAATPTAIAASATTAVLARAGLVDR